MEVDEYLFYERSFNPAYKGIYSRIAGKINGLAFFYKLSKFFLISNEEIELCFILNDIKRHTVFQFSLLKMISPKKEGVQKFSNKYLICVNMHLKSKKQNEEIRKEEMSFILDNITKRKEKIIK